MPFPTLKPDETIGQLMFSRLRAYGERVLLISGDQTMTGDQLADRAISVAGALSAQNLRAGDAVLISRRDPVETVLCYLATWYLGASPMVLDFRTPKPEVARLAKLITARCVIVQRDLGDPELPQMLWQDSWLGHAPPPDGIAGGPTALAAAAHLGQTSGTTGQPNIVWQDQRIFAERLRVRANAQPDAGGKLLVATSLQFSPPLVSALINLINGGPVEFHPILFTPDTLIEAILSSRASMIMLPPPVIRRIVYHVGPRDTPLFVDLKVLRNVGGPALPDDKIAAYNWLSNGYTMAYSSQQTGMVAVLNGPDVLTHAATTGRLLDGVSVEALDDEGNVLPPGEPGRLRIRSGIVATPASMNGGAAVNMGPGWSMPGDIGYVDSDGFLTIQGRQSDVILRGGVNVSIGQLEGLILDCPGIEDAAVVPITDDAVGEEIAVAVVASIDLDQVRRWCASKIPADKRPRRFASVESLPYSIAGKLMRRQIDLSIFE